MSAIVYIFVGLPLALSIHAFPGLRPHPKWTYRQAIMNDIMNAVLHYWSVFEIATHLSLPQASQHHRFIRLNPAEHHYYTGVLAANPQIKPEMIGGMWYPERYERASDSITTTIILYFHGGAFVMGDSSTLVCAFPATILSKSFNNAKVLAFAYRLACNADGVFPAAVQDALTAYAYLLNQGIDAQHIVFAGDSAGCNIALALLRHIASTAEAAAAAAAPDQSILSNDRQDLLPAPRAAILCSPSVDVRRVLDPAFPTTLYRRARADYVPAALLMWGMRAYAQDVFIKAEYDEEMLAYASPTGRAFRTVASLFFCVGGLESLRDEGLKFAFDMQKAGNSVEVHCEPYANHAILAVGNVTGVRREGEKAMEKSRRYIFP